MAKRNRAATAATAMAMRALAIGAALLLAGGGVRADSDGVGAKVDEKAAQETELRGVEDTMRASEEQRRRIEADIESFRADRARLNAALIDTTAKVQEAERQIAAADDRLTGLNASADALGRSLENRRAVVADVLAVLQRMGRNPPPAILVKPQDMAEAIRAAIVLGSTVGELKSETEALTQDLERQASLSASIAKQRNDLARRSASLALDKTRLGALVDARQQSLSAAEQALAAERERDAQLAEQASSLKDLIARMEKEIGAANAADQAMAADVAAKAAAARGAEPARLKPGIAFADAKGLVSLPVAGAILKTFGSTDAFGGAEQGVSIASPVGATVSSPVDGSVLFAGPYRSYGRLLIIDAGGGYYMALAGMDRISVAVGQFVLAGEPVATMGDGTARTAAAVAIGATEPVLYIELRKDGTAIDPGPWWAKSDIEKARG
ncbi:MAG: peptidoglycan DD-metalloendopeptidase family protein [Roseiarcus sp.]|jgi:septal ring factor EnvC (AmiA/AmiB activator)